MAKAQLPVAEHAAEQPTHVLLTCADLGVTRAFSPAHAKALLAYQEAKGYSHWQPAAEGATVTEEK